MADPWISTPVIADAATSPLAGAIEKGTFANSVHGAGVILSERFGLSICDIAAWPDKSATARTAKATQRITGLNLKEAADNISDKAQRFHYAPGRWTIISADTNTPEKLAAAVGENGTVVDLTHGRTVLRIEGHRSEWVLSKLFAIDFALEAFPVGKGLATVHHSVFAQIQRVRADAFDVIVYRSYARSFWHMLTMASGDVGYTVD